MIHQGELPVPLLDVQNLRTEFETDSGTVRAVDGASFSVLPGERIAVVGESGSGKSAMAMSILRLLVYPGRVVAGDVLLDGTNIAHLSERDLSALRGRTVGTVFQDPMSSLDPVMRVSKQMIAPIMRNLGMTHKHAQAEAVEWLRKVGIPDPERRITSFPFEMSGGMRQRVMIAMALSCRPKLLIADEPTTALDVTIQAQIVNILKTLTAEANTAMLFITHDLGLVARLADKVAVMYAGRIVEFGSVADIFKAPCHPYTQSLLRTIPSPTALNTSRLPQISGQPPDMKEAIIGCAFRERCGAATDQCAREAPTLSDRGREHVAACWQPEGLDAVARGLEPKMSARRNDGPFRDRVIVELNKLTKHFTTASLLSRSNRNVIRAVNGVSLSVREGETLGVVGESGCGKSTLARMLLGLETPTSGEIFTDGMTQMVFQDPASSFNPKMRIHNIIEEPLMVKRVGDRQSRQARVEELIDLVGLKQTQLDRFPGQLSGGQLQRVAVARALALEPSVVVADEPTSALDVSVRAQIINLLADLKQDLGVAIVFISHDLLTVRYISDRIAVMYLGEVVEYGPAELVFNNPAHPYTRGLIDAVPIPDPEREAKRGTHLFEGELPSPLDEITGCSFAARCPMAKQRCRDEKPMLKQHQKSREAACHYAG